jgi:hypothetical protein
MHPDGFPVPQERDFYWKNIVLSLRHLVQIELVEHSNKAIAATVITTIATNGEGTAFVKRGRINKAIFAPTSNTMSPLCNSIPFLM